MDSNNQNTAENNSEMETSEMAENSENVPENTENTEPVETVTKHTRLPMARIKHLVKWDPDVSIVSNEAVFVITKATELFIDAIAKEAYAITVKGKRKTVTKKDLQTVLDTLDCLCFTEGMIDI